MDKQYSNIQKHVKQYKNARSTREKNDAFLKLKQTLSQHYKVILSVSTDYIYKDNPQIKSMIMGKLLKPKNMSYQQLEEVIKGVFADSTYEDIETIVDSILINLLNSYVRDDIPFIQYFTWLLPKRFGQLYVDLSKDALNQFYNFRIDSLEDDDNYDYKGQERIPEQTFLEEFMEIEDYNLLLDSLDEISNKELQEKYQIENIEFEIERVKSIAENILHLVLHNKQYIENQNLTIKNIGGFLNAN